MTDTTKKYLNENIDTSPLSVIDRSLILLGSSQDVDHNQIMKILLKAIAKHHGKKEDDNDKTFIFDKTWSNSERRFIAICLLRLLALNNECIETDKDFYVKTFSIFDEVLSEDIYKKYKVSKKEQNFEKANKLKDVVPDVEKNISDVIESINDIDNVEKIQNSVLKTLNSPIVKSITHPFCTKKLIKNKVSDIFEALKKYKNSDEFNIVEEYENSKQEIENFVIEARKNNTKYNKYLIQIVERMKEKLEQDFQKSNASQPAKLKIIELDKKYPFNQKGNDLDLKFIIENYGPGIAFNVELSMLDLSDNLKIDRETIQFGKLEPGSFIANFSAHVIEPEEIAISILNVSWYNADNTFENYSDEFTLVGQRADIPWDELEFKNPYSLEPIEFYDDLVGRKEMISQLMRQSCSQPIGSSFISGQKRVGKTSIAKALASKLNQEKNFISIYLEGGEYIDNDAEVTISYLGNKLCSKLKNSDERFSHLSIPTFEGALHPLSDFLDSVKSINPDLNILFIIDEFDELPIDLYRRGPLADAFFLTIRTISGKSSVGLVLVGGEKMDFIMSCQGDALNKFQSISVNYFDRSKHWADFQELIRKPTKEWLEIQDNAIVELYEQTSGNPFYTIFICRELFIMMVDRRDYHVTNHEISEAVQCALQKMQSNVFQHFWEDGIFEASGDRVEEISMLRRRILVALGDTLREKNGASSEEISNNELLDIDLASLENELHRFVQRKILTRHNNIYNCQMLLFKSWLIEKGIKEIMTTFVDRDSILDRKQQEENAYVTSEEIINLTSCWDLYRGKQITEDHVRAWLNQFDNYISQRLMFKILQKIKFYSQSEIRSKMNEAYNIIRRDIIQRIEYGKRKQSDIIVSYIDGPGKSGGGKYAKLFADENGIYAENVIERGKLADAIYKNERLQSIVFIDDFIGTGESAKQYFIELKEDCNDILDSVNFKLFYIAITGFQKSKLEVEETINHLRLPIQVHICDTLDSQDICFNEDSYIFSDESERINALRIAHEIGSKLVKKYPLGYGDCQTAIVFSDSCPNNNLPILWKESSSPEWMPLFKRPIPKSAS